MQPKRLRDYTLDERVTRKRNLTNGEIEQIEDVKNKL
jgi:hypothetical protein